MKNWELYRNKKIAVLNGITLLASKKLSGRDGILTTAWLYAEHLIVNKILKIMG